MLTHPDPVDGALELMCLYSRLEYALKRSGCLTRDTIARKVILADGTEARCLQADPDWKDFVSRPLVAAKLKLLEASESACYLRSKPPMMQIAVEEDSKLSLQLALPKEDVGGRIFSDGPMMPSRDQRLIEAARHILKALIEADPVVLAQFEGYP